MTSFLSEFPFKNLEDFRNEFDDDTTLTERWNMVKTQIFERNVKDYKVLKAMLEIPRHIFVSASQKQNSYCDYPLSLIQGQTISQPYIVAYMTEQLTIKKNFKVLEIGTGCGYQTAVLAKLAEEIYTIEIIDDLYKIAQINLAKLKLNNIRFLNADGYYGWQDFAPFDAIILTAAPQEIPQPLLNQLNENGKLIAPVGSFFQELILAQKINNQINYKNLISVSFVRMTGKKNI
ncbi:MAG TPA: protein-L-isoaspartate(D-aspartate) O-methyltransferase [bacterium]|nr:protein-L-isoaspartate(D-aspartate) O-methyltransferase [bacterium]HPP86621.1 protein-L-isoaspartate(D-aspartate) O-methyltransferase [bacterium]